MMPVPGLLAGWLPHHDAEERAQPASVAHTAVQHVPHLSAPVPPSPTATATGLRPTLPACRPAPYNRPVQQLLLLTVSLVHCPCSLKVMLEASGAASTRLPVGLITSEPNLSSPVCVARVLQPLTTRIKV